MIAMELGIIHQAYNFLANPTSARIIIIIALIWRWKGYNMVFYLAGLQNIEYSVYEAAKIDGASALQTFFKITVPLLKPTTLQQKSSLWNTQGAFCIFLFFCAISIDDRLNLFHQSIIVILIINSAEHRITYNITISIDQYCCRKCHDVGRIFTCI